MNDIPVEQQILQVVLNVVVAVAAPILLTVIGMILRRVYQAARAKLSKDQLALADMIIRMFVVAAEQYDLGGVAQRVGSEKKKWVIERAEAELAKRGVRLDLDIISDIIEAAVLDELNKPGVMNANTGS